MEHNIEENGTTLSLDTWLAIAWRLRLGPDCSLMLTLLETHKGALEWLRHSLHQQFFLAVKERQETTSLLNRIKKMLTRFPRFWALVERFFQEIAQVDETGNRPLHSLTAPQTRCALRLVRLGWDATTSLYQRHDQLAGFSNHVLQPLRVCSRVDVMALSVGEAYVNIGEDSSDAHTPKRVKYLPLLSVVTGLQSRVAWLDVHLRDGPSTDEECAKIQLSRRFCVDDGIQLVTTLATHSLCSVWSSEGKSLLYHEDFTALHDNMVVYSGRPELFTKALWIDENLASIIEALDLSLASIMKESGSEEARQKRLEQDGILFTMPMWRLSQEFMDKIGKL